MHKQPNWKAFQDLEVAIEKSGKNDTCLYLGCKEKPIGSHIIARKTLRLIAEKSKVLLWYSPTTWDMHRQVEAGKPLEELSIEPISVGIHDKRKVTHPIFCNEHDSSIFAPLDNEEIAASSASIAEQVALLAYRELCSGIYKKQVTVPLLATSKKNGYRHPLSEFARNERPQQFQSRDILLKAQSRYEQMCMVRDYTQLAWSFYLVNVEPCVAATYSFIPANDGNIQSIVDGTAVLTAEDVVSFTFLPYAPLNNSICVMSWFKGSLRAQHYLWLHRINELSEKDQQNFFLSKAFESPTLYISPTWWSSLSEEEREKHRSVHHTIGAEHAYLAELYG